MKQAEVTVYLSQSCFYCIRAQRLLDGKGVRYTPIVVDGQAELWDEMEARSGRNTVPQIFIGQRAIGGFTDLRALDQSGQLDALLYANEV